ncbi:hypothetical protein [Nitrosospira sp. Nsp1]|uniref:hypothetical protein n=1 Tax=Nitrosospira sp. Nsp1 TaxID=136547 RepID=UPI00087E7702|nr:hypothetical protein [Nitrosospira sp. Nsp1]SCX60968.1 hypothetical protein SAMN05720354_12638 [Nitrosospira sp. Nsp1]
MRPKTCNQADTLPEYSTNPEQALAALICLMSRFPARRSRAVAAAIIIHLRLIRDDPRLSHVVRDCADNLIEEWEAYAALCAPDAAISQWRLPN